ncbi:MAG TPA: hypothetical protein VK674_06145 [Candidatus Limnocylindria bacterium]|nr:hypothetical protein [Candidatus Limnocylindria bacterium]
MSDTIEQLSIRQGLLNIYHTSREEFTQANGLDRTVLGLALVGLGFDWSTGNESMLSLVGANLHEATDSPVLTGLGMGGLSFVEQTAIGLSMVGAISRFPRIAESVRGLATRGQETSEVNRSRAGRLFGAFLFGASVEVASENARRKHTVAENAGHVLVSASLIGGGVVAVGGAASGILELGERNGLEAQTDTLVGLISNPLAYAGVFAAKLGYDKARKFIKARGTKSKHSGSLVTENALTTEETSNG